MKPDAKIFVAGHRGLAGSAILRELKRQGCEQLLCRTRQELDLFDADAVRRFYATERPEYVFVAAARVGGIWANDHFPAEFIHENLLIQNHLIHGAAQAGVRKLLFLGSSCIYPKHAPQPLQESSLLSGPLEPTNQWYAVAKIAGIKLCQACCRQYGSDFISVMPTNLYGPNDHYDPQTSHVLQAMIRRFHEARLAQSPRVTCWGSGTPRREFLHADDLARAGVFLMQHYSSEEIINVGFGSDVTIKELAEAVRRVVGYVGDIVWDTSQPDGTPRKLLDSSRIGALGWQPQVDLETGLRLTYADFLKHHTADSR